MPSSTRAAAYSTGGDNASSASTSDLPHDLEKICKPYVDAFFLDLAHNRDSYRAAPRASLHERDCANSHSCEQHVSLSKNGSRATAVSATMVAIPTALLRECSQMFEAAAQPPRTRPPTELEAENAYLRAVLSRMLQQQQQPLSSAAQDGAMTVQEVAPASELSPRPAAHPNSPEEHTQGDGSDSHRSPSAACPEPVEHAHMSADAVRRALVGRRPFAAGGPRDVSPATAFQVGELQEQIELLREAVRELSQQASVARGHSASPLPADARVAPFALRAVSPSPRCATPTCTTDVSTLQRIILHQQQTIRKLQLEMEEVESAKVQIEQLLHLHEAAEMAGAADAAADIAAALHEEKEEMEGEIEEDATAQMYVMDFDAAAEMAKEKRRAATYGGAPPPSWLDSSLSLEEPIHLPSNAADVTAEEEEQGVETGDEAPSSGMRTPLPRRTVVLRPLQQRYSSMTTEESPVMRPTKASSGTVSNRYTAVIGSFSAT